MIRPYYPQKILLPRHHLQPTVPRPTLATVAVKMAVVVATRIGRLIPLATHFLLQVILGILMFLGLIILDPLLSHKTWPILLGLSGLLNGLCLLALIQVHLSLPRLLGLLPLLRLACLAHVQFKPKTSIWVPLLLLMVMFQLTLIKQ